MSFSNNLRNLRRKFDMSQDELADKLGYKSFTTIQKWESGVSEPSVSTVKQIAEIFGVSIDVLTGDDSVEDNYYIDPEAAKFAQEVYERPEMRVLFDAARDVSKEDLQLAIDMLMRLKK